MAEKAGPVYKPEGYTAADQESDKNFLIGARFGRQQERARLVERLASEDVREAVAEAIWSAPRNGTSWDVAKVRTTAAIDAIKAALTEETP